jgi:hypothetical protein
LGQTLPAVVQTFESYSPTTEANDFKLVNSGNASGRLTNATVDTTAPSTALVAGAALIKFSFLIPALQSFVSASAWSACRFAVASKRYRGTDCRHFSC